MSITQKILIPFDMIIDTDTGIVKCVKEFYNNEKYIDSSIFKYTNNQIKYLLLNRLHPNPLSLVIKGYNDSLYDEIYDRHTNYIVENSEITQLINMILTSVDKNLITMTVLCKNKVEETFIKSKVYNINSTLKTTVGDIDGSVNLSGFTDIFIKYKNTLSNSSVDLGDRELYINRARYNMERNELNELVISTDIYEYYDTHQVSLISMYNVDSTYLINKEDI